MMLNKIKLILTLLLSMILLNGCGYKVLNKSNGNYNIIEITESGETRINYKIKNQILFESSKESPNILKLNIKTNKQKQVRDKNIKNEITSYILTISTQVSYLGIGESIKGEFTINQSGSYEVSSQRINTLNNEKSLTETLTNNIIEKIKSELNNIVYDN